MPEDLGMGYPYLSEKKRCLSNLPQKTSLLIYLMDQAGSHNCFKKNGESPCIVFLASMVGGSKGKGIWSSFGKAESEWHSNKKMKKNSNHILVVKVTLRCF